MPQAEVHAMYYKHLLKEVPGTIWINPKIIQDAIDAPRIANRDYNKLQCHSNFDNFKQRYMIQKNKTYDIEMSKYLEKSLKYYWVCHLVVDMVQNKSKNYIPNGKPGWKRISNLGEPFTSYGRNLLLKMGVAPECIVVMMIGSKECLLISEAYYVNRNDIKFRDPLKTIIVNNYITASNYRLKNANQYAKRIEKWHSDHPGKRLGFTLPEKREP